MLPTSLEEWAELLQIKKQPETNATQITPLATSAVADTEDFSQISLIDHGVSVQWWQAFLGLKVTGKWNCDSRGAMRAYCRQNNICHVRVNRFANNKKDVTISEISILRPDRYGYEFMSDGLEDIGRDKKIRHETRIGTGTYSLELRNQGGMTGRYKIRFPLMHKGMLWVRNVKGFQYIYLHIGNQHKDTSGCLVVGTHTSGLWKLVKSVIAYRKVYQQLSPFAKAKSCLITFEDND